MTEQQMENFLYRVATDDNYRQQLKEDPVGTCTAAGIEIDPDHMPTDPIDLPSSDAIRAVLSELAHDFTCMLPKIHLLWTPNYVSNVQSGGLGSGTP